MLALLPRQWDNSVAMVTSKRWPGDQVSNLVPGEDRLGLSLSSAGNLDVRARLRSHVPWSICENRRY